MPGFRPGKAPRQIFERFIGREALVEQAVEGMLSTTLPGTIEEQGIEAGVSGDMDLAADFFSVEVCSGLLRRREQ